MKAYKKIRHFERPFVLHLFVGHTPQEITYKINRQKNKLTSMPKDHITNDNKTEAEVYPLSDYLPGHFAFIIWTTDTNLIHFLCTIVHETFHCVAQHFDYIGQPLGSDSEESYAYMQEWIFKEIVQFLKLI